MSDERCPRCGGDVDFEPRGEWYCPPCDMGWLDDEFACAAHFEPRYRLPTEAEERAHAETWGKGAGWMVSVPDISGRWMCADSELASAQGLVAAQAHEIRWWPHVNGRPVGWPTVEEE